MKLWIVSDDDSTFNSIENGSHVYPTLDQARTVAVNGTYIHQIELESVHEVSVRVEFKKIG